MSLSRTTGRIVTLSLLSVLLALVAYDERLSPSQTLTGKLFYNCYSCDSTDGQCKLVLVHETEEIGSPCAALGLGSSCAQACKCPSGTWPCEQNACLAAFSEYKNWISYQPNSAEGYVGTVFDRDHHLYFVPYKNDSGPQGVVWRYDVRGALNTQPSWGSFDPSSNGLGADARGFAGGAFDGKYVYFAPNENASGPSGAVMRYDISKNMGAVASWELYDPSKNGLGASARGYNGAVFDGNYVYFVPDFNAAGAHNNVLRYDVAKPFDSVASWEVFNPKSAASAKKGYAGAIYDGRYVYFVPSGKPDSGAASSSASAGSPTGGSCGNGICDSNETSAVLDCIPGAQSAACLKVFCPEDCLQARALSAPTAASVLTGQVTGKPMGSSAMHGDVLRYDTRAPFGSANSWTTFDPSANGVGSNARGYNGAAYDGTYIYFAPYINSGGPHGEVLRYNTKQSFTTASSWTTFNVSTGGVDADAKGYIGAAFDGQFVYFSPYYNGKAYHGKVLRYNTKGAYADKLSWTVYDIGTAQAPSSSAGASSSSCAVIPECALGTTWNASTCKCESGVSSVPAGQPYFTATTPGGTVANANQTLTVPAATQVTFAWSCPGATITPSCSLTLGTPTATTTVQSTGQQQVTVVGPGTTSYTIRCTYVDSASVTQTLCNQTIPVAIGSPEGVGAAPTQPYSLTGPNGETMNANGGITVPVGARVSMAYDCSGQRPVPAGYSASVDICSLKNGAGTELLTGDAIYRNKGGLNFITNNSQTYTFSCSYNVCSLGHGCTNVSVCSYAVPVTTY